MDLTAVYFFLDRGLKAVGLVWDGKTLRAVAFICNQMCLLLWFFSFFQANSRRGVANDARDMEDLDSEHYCTSLSAFLVLIEVSS